MQGTIKTTVNQQKFPAVEDLDYENVDGEKEPAIGNQEHAKLPTVIDKQREDMSVISKEI